jgi:hypothetical protein
LTSQHYSKPDYNDLLLDFLKPPARIIFPSPNTLATMYQVRPAHPIQTKAIWDYEETATPTMASFPAQQSYPSNVQLPRKLQRPSYAEVPRQNVAAVAPELSEVPMDYVRRGLKMQADQ